MAERSLRFGVRDPGTGLRAATWKLWTAQGKPDVYLVCRQLGSEIKLSLHESGRWHFAFGSKELFDEDSLPDSRFLGVYEKAAPLVPGITLACRIHTPWFASTVPFASTEEPNTVWIEPAPEGHSIEVAIALYANSPPPDDWLGRDSMGTNLVGRVDLNGGGCIVAVQHTVPFVDLLPKKAGNHRFFKRQTANDLQTPGTRMIGWGLHEDGSIVVMEGPVLVQSAS